MCDKGLTEGGRGQISILGRRLSPAFERRVIVVLPGSERAFDAAEWRGALVVVDRGAIELECLAGSRRRFRRGDMLWLTGLQLRALHNSGRVAAILIAVSRRATDESAAGPGSTPS